MCYLVGYRRCVSVSWWRWGHVGQSSGGTCRHYISGVGKQAPVELPFGKENKGVDDMQKTVLALAAVWEAAC